MSPFLLGEMILKKVSSPRPSPIWGDVLPLNYKLLLVKLDQGTLGMSDPSQVNLHQGHQGHQAIRTTRAIRATNKKMMKTMENNEKL